MRNRKSKNGEQPSIVLRRSPKVRYYNQTEPEDLKTPNLEHGSSRVSFLEPPPFISAQKVPLQTGQNHSPEVGNVPTESDIGSEGSAEPYTGSRRTKRLNSGVEGFNGLRRSLRFCDEENVKLGVERVNFNEPKRQGNNVCNQLLGNVVKRVKRSSSQRLSNVKADKGTCTGYIEFDSANFFDKVDFSYEQTAEAHFNLSSAHFNLSKQSAGKIVKKKTGSSNWENADKPAKKSGDHKSDRSVECSKYECEEKGAFFGVDKKAELVFDSFLQVTMGAHSSRASLEIGGERKGAGVEKEQKCVDVKRKRNQVEEDNGNHGVVQGWTKDQELALQKAYFTTKPTPRFWKKVSGMVPGKSAQDCFNKIHADHLTPPQSQTRSRAKVTNSSSLSLSATKLLDSAGPNSKKPRYSKQKSHLAQKTVRQLLQKQHQADQDQNTDLFSVLEPTPSPSAKAFRNIPAQSTTKRNLNYLKDAKGDLLQPHRKQFSRFDSSSGATLQSPPVLKQVKNRALHEKYIDQLNKREAKRKAVSAKAAKSSHKKVDGKKSHVQKINAIEAAKNALVRDARDAISQFQHVQVNAMSRFSDADDDVYYSDEDEGDDRP